MIVYNQQNDIAADQWNVWICAGGWGIYKNSSVESGSRDKYNVNETSDKQIVWNHLTRGYFLMIVYNQQNQIPADLWNVQICTVGCGIFENSSVESDIREKSDVNKTADQQI